MTAPGRIYLGLPAYNEEIALPRLLARVERFAASSQLPITVVVYDDGSTDTTPAIASEWRGAVPVCCSTACATKASAPACAL